VKDKSVMIPLSGGYDSRIIALLIKEYGHTNVSSFTYGRAENPEARKSKEIADILGFNWTIFPYTKENWFKWYHSKEWDQLVKFSSNYSSMTHIQDAPAVTNLVKDANEKYVFIPGHTGDFISGDHIPFELTVDKEFTADEVVQSILGKHHRLWSTSNQDV